MIELAPYDPRWPTLFLHEKQRLQPLLEPWLAGPIEHVGSTAVPGLVAKPVIDLMVAVSSLDASRPAIAVLEANGYLHYPYRPQQMHWFCRPSPEYRTHHLHLIPHDSRLWRERLAFRDELRRNPEVAQRYASLKQALAERHRDDREAYTDGKGPFVHEVVTRVLGSVRRER